MSWSGNVSIPNWAGNDNAESGGGGGGGGSDVGDLYIVPNPTTIEENPSIGLEERNEIPLPTKYRDLEVKNLTAETINGGTIDITRWSLYRAISDVRGTLGAFSLPLYSIADFLNITCANTITATAGSVNAGLNVNAGVQVNAPVGSFGVLTVAEDINVSASNETADVNIYGANLLAGDNALYVEGGTTLTGGGIVHGTTIGALRDPTGTLDLVRIDVLPAGMLLTSATFITITSLGATAVSGAGTLALAGGDYITYNSDEHRFINTTAGNDYTDILVGNIHPAFTGSANLRINGGGSGRGVELADVKSLALWTELPIATWVNSTSYAIGDKVKFGSVYYNCVVANSYTQPNIPIPNWVSASNYIAGTIVFSSPYAFRCSASISGSTTPPNPTSDPNWFNLGLLTNDITAIWTEYFPHASTITGDALSSVDVGIVGADIIGVDLLAGKTDPYLINVNASLIADSGVRVINEFNSIQLKGKPSFNATFGFLSSTSDVSTIAQDNSTGQMVITTSDGLTIDTNTSTDFSAGDVVNLKNLTLTSDLYPTWNDVVVYPLNTIVEWDGQNWRSEIADNTRNEPSTTLQNWDSGGFFPLGSVRYYAPNNKAYICILTIFGSSTPPPSDTTHFAEFQTGSNGEDVWYPVGAIVESTIVGDRLSNIQIGEQSFVNETGTYLIITADPQAEGTIDALVGSGGNLTLVGTENATLGALTGTAGIVGDSVYIQTIPTTGGSILVEANDELALAGINGVQLASTTGDVLISSLAGDITLNSADALTLGGANTVSLGSTAGDVIITSEVATNITATTGGIAITSDAGSITLTSATETSITAVDYINIQADESVDIISNTSTIAITSGTDTTITATAGDLSLVAGNDISLDATSNTINLNSNNLTNVGTINGYPPLLRIYTNPSIGSAVSLAPSTAEIQILQQAMTLKANTQYMLNMSYGGLTQNSGTGSPNSTWYIIYRVHQGTTPLTTANLWGLAQLFNSTNSAGGISSCFMTTTAGTYTGRFYIRNQSTTIALTIANIQATITEVGY